MNKQNKANNIPYPSVYPKSDGIYFKSEGEERRITTQKMGLSYIKTDIESNIKESLLYYFDNGVKKEITMDRSEYLNPTNLIAKQNIGLDVMRDNVNSLSQHFRNEEERAQRINIHKTLGFGKYEDTEIYKLYKCIGIDSTYEGDKEIKPKGSRETYIKMIKEDILGYPPLELILSIGLSAVVLGYVGEELSLDTQIVHLYGNSTTGKSTALKLAISLFGYPDVKKSGLFSTYNATENALIKQLEGIKGVPFAFDEISMSKTKNFTDMIYKISNGVDKARLNKNSEQVKKEPWLTTIMSNGEKSLVGSANKNAGIHVRVLEIENIVWTKSSEHSEKINSIILENYGHLGFEFATYVMNLGKNQIKTEYKKIISKLKSLFKNKGIKDNFSDRRINKIAIIILTMRLFENMLNIKMNKSGVLKIIVDVEKNSIKQRNFDKSFIEFFKEYISANASKFSNDNNIDTIRDYIGNKKKKNGYLELEILPIKFEEIVTEGGFEDYKVVLKELKKSGYLDCDKDRYTRKRKTQSDVVIPLIVIKIPIKKVKNKNKLG
ncbi:DUF927 domain-containing protein [Paeniclostridium sordellii]|uniref:DUF927 domain-containing protein n=1 Tax=Paraclostridium sordellii TaxID=1505 RepID=UPI0012AF8588|nr:DUF927 domain-containing protein [Paeniclostridium sordellii]MDU4414960.1 DUF927 domain-containing protein [Paeniclostridium sordellii]MRZ30026.1 DUF927 domain-containing protein [Paeniclostridium sordellii]